MQNFRNFRGVTRPLTLASRGEKGRDGRQGWEGIGGKFRRGGRGRRMDRPPTLYFRFKVSLCFIYVQWCTVAVPTREIYRSESTLLCSAVSRVGCLQFGGSATAHCATRNSSAPFAVPTRRREAIPVGCFISPLWCPHN